METFYDRLKKTCSDNHIPLNELLYKCGMSESATNNWRKGHLPNSTALIKISEYLDVSIDYLLTGKPGPELLASEVSLLKLFRKLSITGKAHIFNVMRDILRTGVMDDADH